MVKIGLLFTLLLALLFIARKMARKRELLQTYQQRKQQHTKEVLAALHEEAKMLPPEEAMPPVEAGVREFLELHPQSKVTMEVNDSVIYLKFIQGVMEIKWVLRSAHLARSNTTFCCGHWEVRGPEHAKPETIHELSQLMAKIQNHILFNEELQTESSEQDVSLQDFLDTPFQPLPDKPACPRLCRPLEDRPTDAPPKGPCTEPLNPKETKSTCLD